MKKPLALFLSFLMLFGFGVGARAQTPEELLARTMDDLRGDYTMQGSSLDPGAYEKIIHSGEACAFIRADGVRDIHFADKAIRVYPERNAWHTLSSSESFRLLPLLAPKELPAGAPIAAESRYGSVGVTFDGVRYWYKEGVLWSIDGGPAPALLIGSFSRQADPGVFSLEGMRQVPALQQWLWEPQASAEAFFAEHATMNKIVDAGLSAGLTVLVIAGMPLLYAAVLVLRVLFYFDIYKV